MKRITFHDDDGKVMVELHDIVEIDAEEAREQFRAEVTNDIPVFLKVIIEHSLERVELEEIYNIVRNHGIIIMTDEELEKNINDDLGRTAVMEFKCYNFNDAYDCALELYDSKTCLDGNIDVELNEDPSENMRIWLEKKHKEKVKSELDDISNLIVDMTMKGASEDELARVIRHSMVILDSKKYKLDIPKSAKEQGIDELKEKYQS